MDARRALKRVTAAAVAVVTLSFGMFAAPAAAEQPTTPLVTGWLPYWSLSQSTTSLQANADLFIDASPFWLGTRQSDTASGIEVYFHGDPQARTDTMTALRASGTPVLPAITDGTGTGYLAGVLADPAKRTAHVQQLRDVAQAQGYDGIDLDYEGFAFSDGAGTWEQTRPLWVAFVTELSTAFHDAGLQVSVTIPHSGYWVYDAAAMGAVADQVRVMTYDYHVGSPGPIAPIWWVSAETSKMLELVPAEKLMMGVPTYGRTWVIGIRDADGQPATADSCPADASLGTGAVTAARTSSITSLPGAVTVRDSVSGELKVSYEQRYEDGDKVCTVVREAWLADAQSVADRVELIVDSGARGAALWTVGGEDPAQWPMVREIAQGLQPPAPAPIPAGGTVRIATGAPSSTVIGTLSAVVPQANGYLTAWSCDAPQGRPTSSSVTFRAGTTVPNTIAVRTDAAGEFCVYTSAATHILFDQVAETTELDAGAVERIRDTRDDRLTDPVSPYGVPGREGVVPALGTVQISTGAPDSLVMGNLTVSSPQENGYTSAWPCGEDRDSISSVNNYTAGRDSSNFAAIRTNSDGDFCVQTSAPAHIVWDQSTTTTAIVGYPPVRLGDTRLPTDPVTGGAPLPAGQVWQVDTGAPGQTVFANVTVASPDRGMYTTVYPCEEERPVNASHNFVYAGQTVPTFGIARADSQGMVCVYSSATTALIWDQSAHTGVLDAHAPVRVYDSRVAQ